ncbi:hypothetical protein LOTGIDRAFT_227894 [Lottia gigantea]|uniref:Major facilitator superfamily (MFS) profile domain-containing protein n=1 Tax=Lottia gigantea TaxID=225164 RepID=V4AM23_LOTGI|nr:hypothetical protein LOTGIDRAFT_227894 [Lottia gigantea]ESP05239.1 hypothetical protein LOTGIDRAFT_227894 [Lottia gigantea]
MEADLKLQSLGKCGCYHTVLFLGLGLIYLRGAWHVFAPVYLAADPGHSCSVPNTTNNVADNNFTVDSCTVTYYQDINNSVIRSCEDGWQYGSQFQSTIVTDWNLVCDEDYKIELSTTIYMIGTGCGALGLTYFSDKYGRKKLLIVCLLIQGFVGVGVAFLNGFILFTIMRFFIGLLNMGIGLTVFVMITESYQASVRTIPSVGIQIAWATGIMLLALFGYLIRNWRHLQLLISLPNFIIVIYVLFLPESLSWLVANRKYREASTVLNWAQQLNQHTSQIEERNSWNGNESCIQEQDVEPVDNYITGEIKNSIHDLFCMKNTRFYTLVIIYLFIVNSLIYMGISFSMPVLHGDIFLNLFLSGLVEIPAHIICMFVITRIGRKIPLMIFLFLCAMSTIAAALCPSSTESGISLQWLKTTLFMISKFAITGSYATVYLYSAELFPTVIRNLAMGIASFFENLGAVGAPFIIYAAKKMPIIPVIAFSSATIIGGFLVMTLPETNRQPLPQTISDTKSFTTHKSDINRNSHLITEL